MILLVWSTCLRSSTNAMSPRDSEAVIRTIERKDAFVENVSSYEGLDTSSEIAGDHLNCVRDEVSVSRPSRKNCHAYIVCVGGYRSSLCAW
ncbi:MAG: hypothetical protein M3R43_11420, partial [Acidobacteriota bacterium]|nr:hypothetical protein [Acidobacteriota bacterium]